MESDHRVRQVQGYKQGNTRHWNGYLPMEIVRSLWLWLVSGQSYLAGKL